MIPIIGTMIGLYIITRMFSMILKRKGGEESIVTFLFAIITILFAVYAIYSLFSASAEIPKIPDLDF